MLHFTGTDQFFHCKWVLGFTWGPLFFCCPTKVQKLPVFFLSKAQFCWGWKSVQGKLNRMSGDNLGICKGQISKLVLIIPDNKSSLGFYESVSIFYARTPLRYSKIHQRGYKFDWTSNRSTVLFHRALLWCQTAIFQLCWRTTRHTKQVPFSENRSASSWIICRILWNLRS